jgi:hypothetical protein
MRNNLSNLKRRIQIPTNPHLHVGDGPRMSLQDILLLKEACAVALRDGIEGAGNSKLGSNLAIISQEKLTQIHQHFGEEGIFGFRLFPLILI